MHVWQRYPALVRIIKAAHSEYGGEFYCHDFDHVVRVAMVCRQISPSAATSGEQSQAEIAALCHNADRILQKRLNIGAQSRVDDQKVTSLVMDWLSAEISIAPMEYSAILEAVLKHAEKNQDTDSTVLIILKDADRIVNTELDVIMRHAQYFPNLPRFSPIHFIDIPGETFKNPMGILSSLLQSRREWMQENGIASIRLPKARVLLRSRLAALEAYAEAVYNERKNSGLVPYPVELC